MATSGRILAKKAYSELYAVSKGMEKTSVCTLEDYLASPKKPKQAKSSVGEMEIVFCGENLPAPESLRLTRSMPSALVTSGNPLPVELIEKIKGQKNFSLIGIQKYLFLPEMETALNSCGFETIHLGAIRDEAAICEPLLRTVKYVFLDMTSVKYADYPWDGNDNPNGFFSNEICQIARYIGFSCNIKKVFIFGLTEGKCPKICARLAAQVAWHIADAFANNIKEDPQTERKKGKLPSQYEHRIVDFGSQGDTITFIMSAATGRWWMEIPVIKKNTTELMPCTASDWQSASEGQIPMRWLYYYNRLNAV